jgi:GNAT superfamily N-acetyltransferase
MFRRLRRYARTARSSFRYEGLPILLWRVVVKAVSPVFDLSHQILFEIDLSQPIPQREARIGCVIEQASVADLDELVAVRYPPAPPLPGRELTDEEEYDRSVYLRQNVHLAQAFRESASTWLEAGELCFVARVGGRIAHSNWIQFHDCGPVDQQPIRLLPTEVYTTEGFTADAWRGLAVHEAVLSHMLRYAQSRGCRRAYTITDLTKAGARRGVLRVGWRQRGHHLFITARWLGRTWVVRLGGDVEPILRDVFSEEPSAS